MEVSSFQVVLGSGALVLWIEVCPPERWMEVPAPEAVNVNSSGGMVSADGIRLRSSQTREGSSPMLGVFTGEKKDPDT